MEREAKLRIDESVPAARSAPRAFSPLHKGRRIAALDELADLADLAGLSVLIVEDDDDAREVLASVLTDCGARVLATASADEAMAIVQRERPDVLVSDIGLPGRNGYDLIRAVRALGADKGGRVPAIALTGYAAIEDSRDALRAGYQVHVAKPIDPSLLTQAVANVAGVHIVDLTR
jgi:CheY-like chemotaxis protein